MAAQGWMYSTFGFSLTLKVEKTLAPITFDKKISTVNLKNVSSMDATIVSVFIL